MSRPLTDEELAHKATLPPDVIYIPTEDGGHHTREENEAYRRTSDETNARYRVLLEEDKERQHG
jgi:hypothetical protein